MENNDAKKRILYVVTKSNFGGAQRYVFELAQGMNRLGHEVTVACGGQGELVERLQQENIATFEVAGFQRDVSVFKEIKALISLAKIIKQTHPEIIHLNSSKAGLMGAVLARILRVPLIVFTVHGWPFLEPRKKIWQLLAWLGSYLTAIFSHRIITVSYNDLKKAKMPFTEKKTFVIHTAINHYQFFNREEARLKLFDDKITQEHDSNVWLTTIAELSHNKNHTTAIDAVAEFNTTHSTKIFYTIIGGGDLLNTLKEQVSLKGLDNYVTFKNYISDARRYLLAFDIFLLPSKKEGLPYALLEAGLAKVPVIAAKVGGIPELISHRESGLLVEPNNHMNIVEALDLLINNPDKRILYSDNLSQDIKTKFSLEEMIKKTNAVYYRN